MRDNLVTAIKAPVGRGNVHLVALELMFARKCHNNKSSERIQLSAAAYEEASTGRLRIALFRSKCN
jgi:hypothetical protein